MYVMTPPVLLLESRVVMSSPAEGGHSNWTLTQTGGCNCRFRPLALAEGEDWTPRLTIRIRGTLQ